MMEKYPYFLYPVINELRNCTDPVRRKELQALVAVNVGDPDIVRDLTGAPEDDLRFFYPGSVAAGSSVEDSIDSFIAKYGGSASLPVDPALLQPSDNLTEEEEKPVMEEEREEEVEERSGEVEEREEEIEEESVAEDWEDEDDEDDYDDEEEEDDEFEEELEDEDDVIEEPQDEVSYQNVLQAAMAHVKNHNYGEALAIMERFYLNNPKKSVYFADQIRFIRKLMINESKK